MKRRRFLATVGYAWAGLGLGGAWPGGALLVRCARARRGVFPGRVTPLPRPLPPGPAPWEG